MEPQPPRNKRSRREEASEEKVTVEAPQSDPGGGSHGMELLEEAGVPLPNPRKAETMANPLVLDKIAALLPARDLLALRETWSAWNSSFIPQRRVKHTPIRLEIGPNWDQCAFAVVMGSSNQIPFSKYDLRNCGQSLEGFEVLCGGTVTSLRVEVLWQEHLFGEWKSSQIRAAIFQAMPALADLELGFYYGGPRSWSSDDADDADDDENEPIRRPGALPSGCASQASVQLPRLKRFRFQWPDSSLRPVNPEACTRIVWKLFQSATELESLELAGSRHTPPYGGFAAYTEFLVSLFARMRDQDNGAAVHKLKNLRLGYVNSSVRRALIELGLRLEKFSVCIKADGWGQKLGRRRLLSTFLDGQRPTLQNLTFWLQPMDSWYGLHRDMLQLTLPPLDSLHTLTINDARPEKEAWHLVDFELQIEDLGVDFRDPSAFASAFPTLKILEYHLNQCHQDQVDRLQEDGRFVTISHPHVTQLRLDATIQQTVTVGLPTRFPAVTRLDLKLYRERDEYASPEGLDPLPELYASLWTLWPALTHLKLSITLKFPATFRPDEFLTGVPAARIPDLRSALLAVGMDSVTPDLDGLRALAHGFKSRPGIADLARLQEFEMDWSVDPDRWRLGWDEPGSIDVTGIGGYLGLGLVGPQLARVVLTFEGDPQRSQTRTSSLSKRCLQFLQSRMAPPREIKISHRVRCLCGLP